jgi:hypothetical protein
MRSPFGREPERRRWDLLVEGASGSNSRILWWDAGKRVLALAARLGMPGKGCGQRHGASAGLTIGLEAGRQHSLGLRRGTPRIPSGVMAWQQLAGAAPTAWPTQGRRRQQWQSGVAEDGLGQKAGLPPRRKLEEVRGGYEGESPGLGDGVTPRVLVTTSRLQRLVRSISLVERAARR